MKPRLLTVSLAVAATAVLWNARAAQPSATDSVSTALATVWGANIAPILENRYPGDDRAVSEFVRGMRQAFELSPVDEPYYQGVLQGMTLVERFKQMRQIGFPLDADTFTAALQKMLAGGDTGFTAESADRYLAAYLSDRYDRPDTLDTASQRAFVAEQALREGAVTTPSGLVFEVITEGEGDMPTSADRVKVSYAGRLADGTVFDETDAPVVFPVSGLVPGFSEGLKMMRPGGTYRIVIPPELGYGANGAGGGTIPGNAALDFTITLEEVIRQ